MFKLRTKDHEDLSHQSVQRGVIRMSDVDSMYGEHLIMHL